LSKRSNQEKNQISNEEEEEENDKKVKTKNQNYGEWPLAFIAKYYPFNIVQVLVGSFHVK